jgi:diguanylate cyclase (GGDEF)-like protein
VVHGGQKIPITISIGVCPWDIEDTLDTLLQTADVALYEAKETGRNRVFFQSRIAA